MKNQTYHKKPFIHSKPLFCVNDESGQGLKFGDVIDLGPGPAFIWKRFGNSQCLAEWIPENLAKFLRLANKRISEDRRLIELSMQRVAH